MLTLNRPDRLNAWTREMEHALLRAARGLRAREDVRVIVVTGAGRGFCAGADMQDLQALGERHAATAAEQRERRPQTLPAVRSPSRSSPRSTARAPGIGLVQALMCDIRFAADGAKLTTAFARRGLVAEHGISWILPRLVGPARALDLLLSGRVSCSARRPPSSGSSTARVAGDALLERDARLRARARRELLAGEHGHDEAPGLRRPRERPRERAGEADRLMLDSFTRPDFVEGVASFVERREPEFAPLGGVAAADPRARGRPAAGAGRGSSGGGQRPRADRPRRRSRARVDGGPGGHRAAQARRARQPRTRPGRWPRSAPKTCTCAAWSTAG